LGRAVIYTLSLSALTCGANCNHLCGLNCVEVCLLSCSSEYIPVTFSIVPPWLYSYQCSSAVITNYAPVLEVSFTISGIILPIFTCWLLSHDDVINRLMPTLKTWRLDGIVFCADPQAALSLYKQGGPNHHFENRLWSKVFLNICVLLTFGLACPLLALTVLVDGVTMCLTVHMRTERYVHLCELGGIDRSQALGTRKQGSSISRSYSVACLTAVCIFVGIFWSLFVFDMIGDVYGAAIGGACTTVPLIGPLLMCFMILALDWRKAPIETMSTADDSTGKQRQDSTMNPVLMPQNTSEQFEML
jgi:hypothetical protein